MQHGEIVQFIWGVADLLRDHFKRSKYQDVILPLTVLRRIDCVLARTKEKVLETHTKYKGQLDNPDALLRKTSGFAFYNTSRYDFERLAADAAHLKANLRNYIAGFSPNMREVIEKFDFDNTIHKLEEAGLLFMVVERFKNVDLHPSRVDNATMGTVFEELIRKFNEALNENPGEHFTPRDVVHLMADLLVTGDEKMLRRPGTVVTVCDPCCGTGGMLTITRDRIVKGIHEGDKLVSPPINKEVELHLFGQECNPETFAVCKSDLYLKSADGRDADHINFGSTLSKDLFMETVQGRTRPRTFNYLITNPPYGKDWKLDQEAVQEEHRRGDAGRFGVGLPRISDGQLLFLQHMIAHMKPPAEGGSRISIIMNGSPLFTGDAGSGESEIRRWIFENDWLEALVALPEQMFYNTGIATYIWILSNRKAPERKGKVLLVDATSFWEQMPKSLGDKRRRIPVSRIEQIVGMLREFKPGKHAKIFPTEHFGFRKITVERPLRLNFKASAERLARLEEERAFRDLAVSKKKSAGKAADEAEGRAMQARIRELLAGMPKSLFTSRDAFEEALDAAAKKRGVKVPAPIRKAILSALSERDAEAEICRDRDGNPEPDPDLRDTESVPLEESIEAFFKREVLPHVPDAWIDTSKCDPKDGEVGLVGYEINFNRYFYKYVPPRPLEEIESDIRKIEKEIVTMLRDIAGGIEINHS